MTRKMPEQGIVRCVAAFWGVYQVPFVRLGA